MKHIKIYILTALFLTLTSVVSAAPVLRQGAEGHDVRIVQEALRSAGYNIRAVDGIFGNETYRALIAFQRDNKIKITGIVDRETWKKLKEHPSTNGSGETAEETAEGNAAPRKDPERPSAKTADASSKKGKPSKKGSAASEKDAAAKRSETPPFLDKAKANAIIRTAKKYLGTRYLFGGTTPKGFDCSGFLQYVFKKNGCPLPRTADEQYKLGKKIKSQKELVPGDLVFFSTYEKGASHSGLYLGGGKFIHVSSSKGVRIDELRDRNYWKAHWYGGRHIVK